MSVQEQGAPMIPARTIEIRPAIVRVMLKVARSTFAFFVSLVVGDESKALKHWSTIERVKWHPGVRHEPVRPTWQGGLQ